jgi:hypothetical protein
LGFCFSHALLIGCCYVVQTCITLLSGHSSIDINLKYGVTLSTYSEVSCAKCQQSDHLIWLLLNSIIRKLFLTIKEHECFLDFELILSQLSHVAM